MSLLGFCMSAYVGEKCQGCGKTFESIQEIEDREAVWWPHEEGRIGCKDCYTKAGSPKK